jgi:hypothetical protein
MNRRLKRRGLGIFLITLVGMTLGIIFSAARDRMKYVEASMAGAIRQINLYLTNDPEVSVNGFETMDGTEWFFLPYGMTDGEWSIDLPTGTNCLIDGQYYEDGDQIKALDSAADHEIVLGDALGNRLDECVLRVRCAEGVPCIVIDTASGSTDTLNASKENEEGALVKILYDDQSVNYQGIVKMSGHGNSTWSQDKKSYNLTLTEDASLLGLSAQRRWTIISNCMDLSQIRNKLVYDTAVQMGVKDQPTGNYANVYINREYVGVYLLTQNLATENGTQKDFTPTRVETIKPVPTPDEVPSVSTSETDADGLVERYFNQKYNIDDITGDYLLEFQTFGMEADPDTKYGYFTTPNKLIAIRSTKYADKEEVDYNARLCREAEKAIYAENGINPDTGKSYTDYIDTDSFALNYLIQDFFDRHDYTDGSLFMRKNRGDDKLYSGVVWDYDKAMTDEYYDDIRYDYTHGARLPGWYQTLDDLHPEFHARVVQWYKDKFSDTVGTVISSEAPALIAQMTSSWNMDDIRYGKEEGFTAAYAGEQVEWLSKRKALFDQVWIDGEDSPYAQNIY